MNRKIFTSIFFIFLVFIVSCKKESENIVYTPEIIDNKTTDKITLELIQTNFELGFPETIDFISDSLMIIFDKNINDKVAHIVDIDGNLRQSFGKKGHGEGELIQPVDITLNSNRDSVFIYDSMQQRLLGYDIKNLLCGNMVTPSKLKIDINTIPGQEYRFSHVERGADSLFLGFTNGKNRIVSLNHGRVTEIYTDYPTADSDTETNRSIWNYTQSRNSLSPDGTKLVVVTYIGGIFETFDINGMKISSRTVKGFFKPEYVYAEGAIPKCVTFNPQKMITGFRTVYASNDHFITVLDGLESKRMNEILFFDYDGNLISRMKTDDGLINIIGESPKGEIYAIAYNNDLTTINLFKII